MVTGLFRDRESAERAYGSLTGQGYGQDDVNLVSDETRKRGFAVDDRETELGNKALKGAGTGAAVGGAVGAALAAIAAIGTTLALPGGSIKDVEEASVAAIALQRHWERETGP